MREFVAIDVIITASEFLHWDCFCAVAVCFVVCDVLVDGASSIVVAASVVV